MLRSVLIAVFFLAGTCASQAQQQRFSEGNWIVECTKQEITSKYNCTVTLTFVNKTPAGVYSLMIIGLPPEVSLVGAPVIAFATLGLDQNPGVGCRGPQICKFPLDDQKAILKQLPDASTARLRVETAKGYFEITEDVSGYRAILAKIKEWGFIPVEPKASGSKRQ